MEKNAITLKDRKNWMRNKPCPCKSGKKFKHCCWGKIAKAFNKDSGGGDDKDKE